MKAEYDLSSMKSRRNVRIHTTDRIDALLRKTQRKRLTYKALIA